MVEERTETNPVAFNRLRSSRDVQCGHIFVVYGSDFIQSHIYIHSSDHQSCITLYGRGYVHNTRYGYIFDQVEEISIKKTRQKVNK